MIGDTYYERGEPVTVVCAWLGGSDRTIDNGIELFLSLHWYQNRGSDIRKAYRRGRAAPRNVVIQRADGTMVCRPFRGLRKKKAGV